MSLTIIRSGGGGGGSSGLVLIAETILGAPVATVTFAVIPGTYRHLLGLFQLRTDLVVGTFDRAWWRADADAGANYDYMYKYSTGGGGWVSTGNIGQTQAESLVADGAGALAGTFARNFCVWEGYALADRYKSTTQHASILNNPPGGVGNLSVWQMTGQWRSLVAITSLTFGPVAGANFAAGSIFVLYGVT